MSSEDMGVSLRHHERRAASQTNRCLTLTMRKPAKGSILQISASRRDNTYKNRSEKPLGLIIFRSGPGQGSLPDVFVSAHDDGCNLRVLEQKQYEHTTWSLASLIIGTSRMRAVCLSLYKNLAVKVNRSSEASTDLDSPPHLNLWANSFSVLTCNSFPFPTTSIYVIIPG